MLRYLSADIAAVRQILFICLHITFEFSSTRILSWVAKLKVTSVKHNELSVLKRSYFGTDMFYISVPKVNICIDTYMCDLGRLATRMNLLRIYPFSSSSIAYYCILCSWLLSTGLTDEWQVFGIDMYYITIKCRMLEPGTYPVEDVHDGSPSQPFSAFEKGVHPDSRLACTAGHL